MRRSQWIWTLLALALAACGQPKDATLFLRVSIEPELNGTCVALEARDSAGTLLEEKRFVRSAGQTDLKVALHQSLFPDTVSLRARALEGVACSEPLKLTALSEEMTATFVRGETVNVGFSLRAGQVVPASLAFGAVPARMTAGNCSPAISVEARDAAGAALSVPLTVSLKATPEGPSHFFSDPGCTVPIQGVRLPGGPVYVQGKKATEPLVLLATSTGLTDASAQVTVAPAAPVSLVFQTNTPQEVQVGKCSAANVVRFLDEFDNPTSPGAGASLEIAGAPAIGLKFFTDPSCAFEATRIPLDDGSSDATFYFLGTQKGAFNLTVSYRSLTKAQQHTLLAAERLAFSSAAQFVRAGDCSGQTTIQLLDQNNNPLVLGTATAVTLTANPATGTTFYAGPCGGSVAINSITIPAGGSAASFYFKSTRAGMLQLEGTAAPYVSALQTQTISPQPPASIAFLTAGQETHAGKCSKAITLGLRDVYGNDTQTAAARNLSLTVAPNNAYDLFSDELCANALAGGTLTIPAQASSANVYYRGTKPGMGTLTATSSGLASATQDQRVVTGPPAKLAFKNAPLAAQAAAVCSGALTLELRDSLDNPSPAPGPGSLAITLAANPAANFTFFSSPGCTAGTEITSTAIPAGATEVSVYFLALTGAKVTVTGLPTMAGVNPGTQEETVLPMVRTGECTIAGNATSMNCAVSPANLNLANTFMTFGVRSATDGPNKANVRCVQTSVSNIRCDRDGTGNGGDLAIIRWYTVEHPRVRVERPDVSCGTAQATWNGTFANSVNTAESFVLVSSRRGGNDVTGSSTLAARLTSGTQVELRVGRDTCDTGNGGDNYDVQVVQFTGAKVERAQLEPAISGGANGLATKEVMPPAITPASNISRAMLLYSYRTQAQGGYMCELMVRGRFSNEQATQLVFSRAGASNSNNCTDDPIDAISWERVEFPTGVQVYPFVASMNETTAAPPQTATLDLVFNGQNVTVDPTRTFVIGGGQGFLGQSIGEGDLADNNNGRDIPSDMSITTEIINGGTQLQVRRSSTRGNSQWNLFVVQLGR